MNAESNVVELPIVAQNRAKDRLENLIIVVSLLAVVVVAVIKLTIGLPS